MFTVKWQSPAIGYEQVFTAKTVWERNDIDGHFVCAELSDGEIRKFENGMVYVMNEFGKTVADYHFASPIPNPHEIRLAPKFSFQEPQVGYAVGITNGDV
jgi:SPX domain protein involved in polyphosphate accumulation